MSKRSVLILFLVILGISVLILLAYDADLTGFKQSRTVSTETNNTPGQTTTIQIYHRTLWDFAALLIIPLMLGIGGFLLNRGVQSRQEHIAQQNAEENLQQDYLDRMTELLLQRGLRTTQPNSEVMQVAKIRTLTVFRAMNGHRKGTLLLFLRDAELIGKPAPIIPLIWADLRGADLREADLSATDLSGAYLTGADLSRADLRGADLSEVDLAGANLRWADLREATLTRAVYSDSTKWPEGFDHKHSGAIGPGADLHGVNLSSAYLNEVDLSGADLNGADLSGADLRGAKVSLDQLNQARSLAGAILPDGTKHE